MELAQLQRWDPASPASTMSALWRAFILPFRHPWTALLLMTIPCGVIAGTGLAYRGANMLWERAVYGGLADPFSLVPPLMGPRRPHNLDSVDTSVLPWLIWLASFAVISLWLCSWQLHASSPHRSKTEECLSKACRRWPAYTFAYAVSIAVPSSITFLLTNLATGLLNWSGEDIAEDVERNPSLVLLFFALRFPGLWLFARLSTLPPVVAVCGWRGSMAPAWALSRRRAIGLSLAFTACAVLSFLIEFGFHRGVNAIWRPFVLWIMNDLKASAVVAQCSVMVAYTIVWAIPVLWIAGIPAIMIRSALSTDGGLDPATFD